MMCKIINFNDSLWMSLFLQHFMHKIYNFVNILNAIIEVSENVAKLIGI